MRLLAFYTGNGVDGTFSGNVLIDNVDYYPVKYSDILDYQKQISEHYNIPKCVITNIIPLAEE